MHGRPVCFPTLRKEWASFSFFLCCSGQFRDRVHIADVILQYLIECYLNYSFLPDNFNLQNGKKLKPHTKYGQTLKSDKHNHRKFVTAPVFCTVGPNGQDTFGRYDHRLRKLKPYFTTQDLTLKKFNHSLNQPRQSKVVNIIERDDLLHKYHHDRNDKNATG